MPLLHHLRRIFVSELSLHDKVVFVTGVSRPRGIGASIVKRLVRAGASVIFHGNTAYDQASDYPDAAAAFGQSLAAELTTKQHSAHCLPSSDLAHPDEPAKLVESARTIHGRLDGLVVNHAYSTQQPIGQWTAADISAHHSQCPSNHAHGTSFRGAAARRTTRRHHLVHQRTVPWSYG